MNNLPRSSQFDTASVAELIRNRNGLHGRHNSIIHNDLLSGIERLAGWIWHQDRLVQWDERVDFAVSWPITLPMLVCAMLNTLHDDVIQMVGDRVAFFQACSERESHRSIDRRSLSQKKRAELLPLAIAEARVSRWSGLNKEMLINAILDARHPVPAQTNKDLELLWQDELASGQERIRVRRAMALMDVGASMTLDGFVVNREAWDSYLVDGKRLRTDDAVQWVRTRQPMAA
jgi:hypothetical protein